MAGGRVAVDDFNEPGHPAHVHEFASVTNDPAGGGFVVVVGSVVVFEDGRLVAHFLHNSAAWEHA